MTNFALIFQVGFSGHPNNVETNTNSALSLAPSVERITVTYGRTAGDCHGRCNVKELAVR